MFLHAVRRLTETEIDLRPPPPPSRNVVTAPRQSNAADATRMRGYQPNSSSAARLNSQLTPVDDVSRDK